MALQVRLSDPANQAKRSLIQTCWNNVEFVRDPSTTRNQHETSAAIRRAMESTVFKHVAGQTPPDQRVVFVDVGGNPTRTRRAAEAAFGANRGQQARPFVYHAQTPLLSAADYHRQQNPHRVGDCRCSFQQCSFRERHVQGLIQPGSKVVYNFTDSIYYIDFQAILHTLVRDNAVAIGCNHEFPSYPTTIAIPHDSVQEGVAEVRADGTVVMQVEGNGTTYHHANFVFPKSEIQGTLFNADFRLSALSDGTYHGVLDNTEWCLSFERLYTCGTYVGWQAIAIPKRTTITINPSLTTFKVGIYAAECLALRATTPEAVRTVVVKMLRRNGTPLESLPRVVAQTLAQIAAVDRPLVETEPRTSVSWWGIACSLRNRLAAVMPAPDVDDDGDDAVRDGMVLVGPRDWDGVNRQVEDAAGALARPAPGLAAVILPGAWEGVPLEDIEDFLRDEPGDVAVVDHPGGEALPHEIGHEAEALNDQAVPAAQDEPAPAEEPRMVPVGNPAPPPRRRQVVAPNRRMRVLDRQDRVEQGMTRMAGAREVALPPVAATDQPQADPYPPIPGPGIVPPVAAEPREARPKNPPVNINMQKLWQVKGSAKHRKPPDK